MPEPLKNMYSKPFMTDLSNEISKHYPVFNQRAFSQSVFDQHWQKKELKQRMRHISECLHQHLPADYKTTIDILKPASAQFGGFEHMFFQDYVECFGLHDFATSMPALEHFTKYSSAEFAVRAFILQDEKRMMKQMLEWARSDNHHVRRLASEGCRPRLPWAISLPAFKQDPRPVLKILKVLKDDESEYVRRSVANNLNDISKDNPETVLDLAQRWLGKSKNTDRLVKHACRTLLKQGNQQALSLFGYTAAEHIRFSEFNVQAKVAMGEKLAFSFLLASDESRLGKCRLEFVIRFAKANGKQNRKVFKISEADYSVKEKIVTKYFSFKEISTRRYYAGQQHLAIIINGIEQRSQAFELLR